MTRSWRAGLAICTLGGMELTYLYAPARDLSAAAAFYRDVLGWAEAWRDGEETIAFQVPDSSVQVMVSTTEQPPGAMYRVPDVQRFLAEHQDLSVSVGPYAIPGGQNAGIIDPGGNTVYIFDQHLAA